MNGQPGHGILLDLLAAHPAITPHLQRGALSALLDPANYLGMVPQMVDAVLEINHKEKGKS